MAEIRRALSAIAFGVLLASATSAAAHQDPPGCTYEDPELVLSVFRSDQQTGVIGFVSECETLYYRAKLSRKSPSSCAFSGGTWILTLPDGSVVPLSDNLPCIGGTTAGCSSDVEDLDSQLISFIVSPQDVEGGFVTATSSYSGGISHTGASHTATASVSSPKASPVASCIDSDPCTFFTCNPDEWGEDACTVNEVECDDFNGCTHDYCDSVFGGCTVDAIDCDDGLACTIDTCNDPYGGCEYTPKNCDDGNPCTVDTCSPDGGDCSNQPGGSALCRAASDGCDAPEFCNGTSAACPANALAASGTVCRPAVSTCDAAESCTGTSAACPANLFASDSKVCRAAAGVCDVLERCTGGSSACPADTVRLSNVICRPGGGVCDDTERCTGSTASCPVDSMRSSSDVCRPAAAACDGVETCTGSTATCPADVLAPSTHVCRPASAGCDAVEHCTGSSSTCPSNSISTAGTACRPALGECDITETCDGSSTSCPADVRKPQGTPCATDNNPCTDDQCVGLTSCLYAFNDDPCNDGDDCTLDDQCSGGQCDGEPDPACTTTTTLPETVCGDANGDGEVSAADAQIALRTAVGLADCELVACDYNGDGDVKTGDALLILRVAVGQPVAPNCPPQGVASPATTPGSTTTTLE